MSNFKTTFICMNKFTEVGENLFDELICAKLSGTNLHSEAFDGMFRAFGFNPCDVRRAEEDVDAYETLCENANPYMVA